jgi:hypothetical protein
MRALRRHARGVAAVDALLGAAAREAWAFEHGTPAVQLARAQVALGRGCARFWDTWADSGFPDTTADMLVERAALARCGDGGAALALRRHERDHIERWLSLVGAAPARHMPPGLAVRAARGVAAGVQLVGSSRQGVAPPSATVLRLLGTLGAHKSFSAELFDLAPRAAALAVLEGRPGAAVAGGDGCARGVGLSALRAAGELYPMAWGADGALAALAAVALAHLATRRGGADTAARARALRQLLLPDLAAAAHALPLSGAVSALALARYLEVLSTGGLTHDEPRVWSACATAATECPEPHHFVRLLAALAEWTRSPRAAPLVTQHAVPSGSGDGAAAPRPLPLSAAALQAAALRLLPSMASEQVLECRSAFATLPVRMANALQRELSAALDERSWLLTQSEGVAEGVVAGSEALDDIVGEDRRLVVDPGWTWSI